MDDKKILNENELDKVDGGADDTNVGGVCGDNYGEIKRDPDEKAEARFTPIP